MRDRKTGIRLERDLFAPVSRFARTKGFKLQQKEFPFFEYRIDLYAFSRPASETIAIELKIRDWRRALYQSLIYQLCSDYVYIAIPLKNSSAVNLETLEAQGVGLIVVDELLKCRIELEARGHPRSESITASSTWNYLGACEMAAASPEVHLRIGSHAEKEYIEKMLKRFDGLTVGANLVEATPGATASLLVKLCNEAKGVPYLLDPMTYAFGEYVDPASGQSRTDLDWIKSDQKVKVSQARPLEKLRARTKN